MSRKTERLSKIVLISLLAVSLASAPPISGESQAFANPQQSASGGASDTPPGALLRWRLEPKTTVMVDDEAYYWNMQGFDQEKVITEGRYQYTVYWNESANLVLARRDLWGDRVQTLTFPDKLSVDDPHRNTALGVSTKDGRLHIVYDHHNNPINYRVSRPGYLGSPPTHLSLDDFGPKQTILSGTEQRATYPRFFNDKDGDLYFIYRHGGSGSGNSILGRYDAATGQWHRVGVVFSRLGAYPPWNNSPSRNAYLSGILFDANDRLHVSWLYREAGAATRSNHDVHYAYSDDYGVTWRNNAGVLIADLSANNPIRIEDPGIVVVSVPGNTGLRGQSGLALDSNNQPHVLSIQSTITTPNLSDLNQHYIHHWRGQDGSWHSSYIDDTSLPYTDRLRRGSILLDKHDNVHVYVPHGGTLWAARASKEKGWRDWDFYPVETDYPVADFPAGDGIVFDRGRWDDEGILTLAVEVSNGSRTGLALMDFSVGLTFAAKPGQRPATPSLSASESLGSSVPGFHLHWTTVQKAELGYNVYRRDMGTGKTKLIASRVAARSFNDGYVDTEVAIGTDYAYHVRAVNRFGESRPSNPIYASIRERENGSWSDYRLEFDFSEISADALAAVFRQQDTCQLYSWQIKNTTADEWAVRPVRIENCNQRYIQDNAPLSFSASGTESHHMAIDLKAGAIATYVDGQPLFELQDSAYTTGLIGFRTANSGGPAFIDNVRVVDSGGAVLFEDDFSSGQNPFVADGDRQCDAEIVDGRLRITSGSWCKLSPYYVVIGDSPPAAG